MGVVRDVALGVLALTFMTFVTFFGRLPVFRNTPIGFLYRFVWIHVPNFLRGIDRRLTGGRLSTSTQRLGHYLLNEKHPIVMFFFIGLLTGAAFLFLFNAWEYLSFGQKLTSLLLLPWPYLFTYLCQLSKASSPHIINHASHAKHLRHYPFDHALFYAGNECRTCDREKPARSKHCPLCRTCVARSDHHCIWVNNCLGMGNYKYFLALLLSTSLLLFWGSFLAYAVLAPPVHWHFEHYPQRHAGKYTDRTDTLGRALGFLPWLLDVIITGFDIGGISLGGVGLLATLTAALPAALLIYHIYLIWAGMTTNEASKWADWKEDMYDGLVFAATVKSSEVYGNDREGDRDNEIQHNEVDAVSNASMYEYVWPVRSRQLLVRTNDHRPPRLIPPHIERLIEPDSWVQLWDLKDVENIYDQGFWNNLIEVVRY